MSNTETTTNQTRNETNNRRAVAPPSSEAEAANALLSLAIDSKEGFSHAATRVQEPSIAALFRDYAAQRQTFVEQLGPYVEIRGVEASETGTAKGQMHRWWIDLKDMVGINDAGAVLAEAERGERAISEAYVKAMPKLHSGPLRAVVADQHQKIVDCLTRVKALQQRFSAN